MKIIENTYTIGSSKIHYYEIKNNLKPLIMIHGQGVSGLSYENVFKRLSKKYHVYSVDCYGHGYSSKDREKYTLTAIGEDLISFIKNVVKEKVYLIGHSSGGLIAAYIAGLSDLCEKLYLEDPPLFSSQGERRFKTFNYIDLSTNCHNFIQQNKCKDFVLYQFKNQKAWDFFPDKSREKIKKKMVKMAEKYRKNHPKKDLKVPFWPKSALSGYKGMNQYDPYFGETFYNNTFHEEFSHKEMIEKITCDTILMKAKTKFNDEGILLAAMSEEDVIKANKLIKNSKVIQFDCGHAIHIEMKKDFLKSLMN